MRTQTTEGGAAVGRRPGATSQGFEMTIKDTLTFKMDDKEYRNLDWVKLLTAICQPARPAGGLPT